MAWRIVWREGSSSSKDARTLGWLPDDAIFAIAENAPTKGAKYIAGASAAARLISVQTSFARLIPTTP